MITTGQIKWARQQVHQSWSEMVQTGSDLDEEEEEELKEEEAEEEQWIESEWWTYPTLLAMA